MTGDFRITFEGREIPVRDGQSVAAALTEAGIRAFRRTPGGTSRGLFCGMGVCQDCLVEVDGRPNQRACMTKAAPGQAVRSQGPHPELSPRATHGARPAAIVEAPDVLILGAGAGGLSAAAAAAAAGVRVLVLDERRVAGGQYYKQAGIEAPPLDAQQAEGAQLVARAEASGAQVLDGAEVWGAFPGPVIYADRDGQAVVVRPKTLIVATGAYERPRFVPGWDLPGVMTTGAAQTLWRSYRTLPGHRVAIVGNGPLNTQVADELHAGGARIALVAEAAAPPWASPRAGLAMAAAAPGLVRQGLANLGRLRRAGIPVRYRNVVDAIRPEGEALRLHLRDAAGGTFSVLVDTVCMNYGFHPQNEILRLLGARFRHHAPSGQLVCERDETCATGVPGLFAVGDCCGTGGAPAAREEGTIAGTAAAAAVLGHPVAADSDALRRLRRHRRFQAALWTVFTAVPQRPDEIAPEVTLCRCEEVLRASIDVPAGEPGAAIGGVKRATRAGMGRCQGRYCAHVLAPMMAQAAGRPMDERAYFAPRVPVKPVPIASILAAEEARRGGE